MRRPCSPYTLRLLSTTDMVSLPIFGRADVMPVG
jgi:hypothetical protein